MPYKSDRYAINNPAHDRRVKLTEADRQAIRDEYAQGGTSHNKLAQKYGVSKRTIQFTLNPEKYATARKQFKERQKDGRYYDKEKHNAYVKKHRAYKKELFDKGLLETESEKE